MFWFLILCIKIIYYEKLGEGKLLIFLVYIIRKYVVKCVWYISMCMYFYIWVGICVFLIIKLIVYNWLCIEIIFGRYILKYINVCIIIKVV